MNKNVTLAIDERMLKAARAYAKRHDTTLNSLIRELLRRATHEDATVGVDEMFRIMDKYPGHSNGWKWNREEIYAERLDRYGK